ncbi:MAG: NAD(P)/FAD-dependent oxidoreductase [Alkaliphilus sp.]
METVEMLIIGAGPAGLCAAISAVSSGAKVLLVDRNDTLGGQLIKQTHMFFGSEKQYAATRGIDITKILIDEIDRYKENIIIYNNTTVLGMYEDGVVTLVRDGKYIKLKPKAVIIATGASEKVLAFPNNDLPGIYGAGAVQTLMNVYGVKPGNRVLMAGAGNIGLIVSYQLMQAGVKVEAIIDAAPEIGGYLVHASKIRRLGVPIYTKHIVKEAKGSDYLEKAVICEVDEKWQEIQGTEKEIDIDVMCISVGLTPLTELLMQKECEVKYVPELGGLVPVRNENYETSIDNIFVAGDVSGVEEASAAMVEGYLAGLCASDKIGRRHKNFVELKDGYMEQLHSLRSGPESEKIRDGIAKIERRA